MLKQILPRFKKDPLGFIERAVYKAVIGPLKYGKADDYDAARYWHDRFSKYGLSYKGSGDQGLSEEESQGWYAEAATLLVDLFRREGIDFQNARVLDIGCGGGAYTRLFSDLGVRNYVGMDITDVLFSEHRKRFPQFSFIRGDATVDKIEGEFDLIVMIGVIQHIVNESKFLFAMENVKNSLAANGVFIVSPITNVSKKHLFYVRSWSLKNFERVFSSFTFRDLQPFHDSQILVVKKPPD